MNRILLGPLLVALAAFSACLSEPKRPAQHAYTLVLLKTGPRSGQLSDSEQKEAFAGHFANMGRLAGEHKLVVAGPYGEKRHDVDLHGLFVIDSADRAEATAWASTDPTSQAGVFLQEYHEFETDAPLREALERDLEIRKNAERDGRAMNPADGARAYVLLTAEDEATARRELLPLLNGGGVILVARLDGKHAIAVLDAHDVAEAQERYGRVLGRIGNHALDDWFATIQLAKMGAQ